MQNSILLTPQRELSLQLENVIFRLLIHRSKEKRSTVSDELKKYYTTMHSHVSTELFVCKEGEITIKIQGGFITLRSGDAAIVPPGIQHFVCRKSDDSANRTVSFLCHKKTSREANDVYKHLSPFVAGKQIMIYRNAPELYDGVLEIIREAEEDEILPVIHAIELLIKMSRMPCQKAEPVDEKAPAEAPSNDIQRMMKLDQLINVFFMNDLSAEEVANHLFISSRQLDRIVKKRYGKTLHCVLIDKRLATAEQMLTSTDMTVDSIGNAVGFGSRSGFYREFVKRHGITPAEFRKKNQNK